MIAELFRGQAVSALSNAAEQADLRTCQRGDFLAKMRLINKKPFPEEKSLYYTHTGDLTLHLIALRPRIS